MNKLYLLLLLTACQTITPDQWEGAQQQLCTNMGAPPGSVNYYDCRRQILVELQREERQEYVPLKTGYNFPTPLTAPNPLTRSR